MIKVITGDSVTELSKLPEQSVHLVVTSPPYDDIRTYGEDGGVDWDFEGTAIQIRRILVDGGVCCWIVNDQVTDGSEGVTTCKQKIFFKEVVGMRIHDTMIWEKIHIAAPDKTRYHQMFEYIFIFSNGAPRVFNPINDRRNLWAGKSPFSYNSKRQQDGTIKKIGDATHSKPIAEFGRRKNLWQGKSRAQETPCKKLPHPAMMPRWLVRDLIISWSNPGDVVLDPFAGSGTVGQEAEKLSRDSVMVDKNPEYTKLIDSAIVPATVGI